MIEVDFSPVPSARMRKVFVKRKQRLTVLGPSVDKFGHAWSQVHGEHSKLGHDLHLRPRFVYKDEPAPGDASDRCLPDEQHRPPASRLVSPRGAVLRLYLTAVAEAQTRCRPGTRPVNSRPLVPTDGRETPAWVDLIASSATPSRSGRTVMSVLDKKLRQLHTALGRLAEPGIRLVDLPHGQEPHGTYEEFQLLDEGGDRSVGEPISYRVPKPNETVFTIPTSLVTQGWIHVLEDTEITLLLMVACGRGSLPDEKPWIAIPGDTRLGHYGIGRDAFGHATLMLRRLGLLHIMEGSLRHLDGRVVDHREGEEPRLHRLKLNLDGFNQPAVQVLNEQLDYQLGRAAS
jgi:hypothetical protein